MSRFKRLLEQQYLKLDLPDPKLTDVQKNTVEKLTSSGKAKYEGLDKMNAIISYDLNGEKGRFLVKPDGKLQKQNEEDQEQMSPSNKGINKLTGGTLNQNDLRIAQMLAGGNAKGGVFFNRNPQKRIEKAYGTIVGKLAQKFEKLASQIKI